MQRAAKDLELKKELGRFKTKEAESSIGSNPARELVGQVAASHNGFPGSIPAQINTFSHPDHRHPM